MKIKSDNQERFARKRINSSICFYVIEIECFQEGIQRESGKNL